MPTEPEAMTLPRGQMQNPMIPGALLRAHRYKKIKHHHSVRVGSSLDLAGEKGPPITKEDSAVTNP